MSWVTEMLYLFIYLFIIYLFIIFLVARKCHFLYNKFYGLIKGVSWTSGFV
jgi:hypothetical protein